MEKKYLLFFIFCAAVFFGKGQNTLTLETAVNTALQNNYSITIARNENEIDALNYTTAKNAVFPTVNFTGSDIQEFNSINQQYSNGNEVNKAGTSSNILTAGLSATLPLFNGFKLYATKNRLEQLLAEGENQLNATLLSTVAGVEIQYYKI